MDSKHYGIVDIKGNSVLDVQPGNSDLAPKPSFCHLLFTIVHEAAAIFLPFEFSPTLLHVAEMKPIGHWFKIYICESK